MARLQCNACKGEYDDTLPDGHAYFHACPPVTMVAVTRAGRKTRVPISDLQPGDLISVRRNDATLEIPLIDLQAGDVREGDVQVERAPGHHRDENTALEGGELEGKRRIRAKGQGATRTR